MATLTLKGPLPVATARKIGLAPKQPEPTKKETTKTPKAARDKLPRGPHIEATADIDVALAEADRLKAHAQLEPAIAAMQAVPLEPQETRYLRLALAAMKAAPSWRAGDLSKTLRKAGREEFSKAVFHCVAQMRAARFIAALESALVFAEEKAEREKKTANKPEGA